MKSAGLDAESFALACEGGFEADHVGGPSYFLS